MSSDSSFFISITLSFGFIGLVANLTLIWAILFRTPAYFRVYSRILIASTACEFVMIACVMITVTKEKIFLSACILQFHGICTAVSNDFCSIVFGVQEYMYTVTCLLLNFSFLYRLRILEAEVNIKRLEYGVTIIIAAIIIVNSPIVAFYHHAETRNDPLVEQYRHGKGVGTEIAIGIVNYTDLFSLLTVNFSMLTSFIPFIASAIMRRMIIRKLNAMTVKMSIATKAQHDMLVKALNLQLTVSSCSLLGAALFTFNLIILNIFPNFPETTDAVVLICNMQNIISAFSNLYIILPYRRAILCIGETAVASSQVSTSIHTAGRTSTQIN